ncbi:MAG: ABC transporter permease [Pirellulales bacterium]|nr:ABC transporter permease [Pirellulales bacterium]
MIVVNSVMAGFTTEMQDRIHGILSDLTFDSRSLDGMRDAQWHMEHIAQVAGDSIEGMTPIVKVPAMLSFSRGGEYVTRQVQFIGIDEATQSRVSDFGKYLQHPENRRQMSFELRRDGYDTRDHQAPDAPERTQMQDAGWTHRLRVVQARALLDRPPQTDEPPSGPLEPYQQTPYVPEQRTQSGPQPSSLHPVSYEVELRPVLSGAPSPEAAARRPRPIEPQSYEAEATDARQPAPLPIEVISLTGESDASPTAAASDPFAARRTADTNASGRFDPTTQTHTGVVLGIALASYRASSGEDHFLLLPGDDVQLTFATAGTPPKASSDDFTVVDFYESKMSEYDATFVFVPIGKLQQLRGMVDPATGVGRVSSIQIKLKPGADGNAVRDKLRAAFPGDLYGIYTWRDTQGPLLAAVDMETAILNVLLFLIIAVAGFGILAIFLMIVVEKTRDIGILKSLGASGRGVMGIFLAYGLSLGLVGSGVGLALGLLFVRYINGIADLLGQLTGQPVFDPSIYYFYKIPTIVNPMTVAWIVAGAVAIAVLASVLPALRAALLHPVEALRYE